MLAGNWNIYWGLRCQTWRWSKLIMHSSLEPLTEIWTSLPWRDNNLQNIFETLLYKCKFMIVSLQYHKLITFSCRLEPFCFLLQRPAEPHISCVAKIKLAFINLYRGTGEKVKAIFGGKSRTGFKIDQNEISFSFLSVWNPNVGTNWGCGFTARIYFLSLKNFGTVESPFKGDLKAVWRLGKEKNPW